MAEELGLGREPETFLPGKGENEPLFIHTLSIRVGDVINNEPVWIKIFLEKGKSMYRWPNFHVQDITKKWSLKYLNLPTFGL